jgi:hypothetical protein
MLEEGDRGGRSAIYEEEEEEEEYVFASLGFGYGTK